MKPGVSELLAALKECGRKTAVASSTRSAVVTSQIRDAGLADYYDVIVCGDMVERGKPDPEIFIKTAEALGEMPENCCVIEDSYNGIRAARSGGMIPIMVPDMMEPDEEMRTKAAYICKDLFEVKKLLCGEN